jgi:hypothetical protein
MDELILPQDIPACPPPEHNWTAGVYVSADVARVCSLCGRVEFPPFT